MRANPIAFKLFKNEIDVVEIPTGSVESGMDNNCTDVAGLLWAVIAKVYILFCDV